MKLEDIIKLKINNFEIKPSVKKEMIEPNPCQEGYEAIGLKEKDGRMVPNCVPIKDGMSVVKEGFPIPSPSGDEDEQAYISRCISSIIDEYGQEQSAAICYATWRDT
jgi:hypothetical protein